ncbi:BON domain-containing protein [Aureimonas sp. AU4]|uniref:BON domain-containing protein n=1 Tax=Aureimonas sp. AU4 TaxID=1638163 RepID=UPI000706372A|nr:BON domain-containing protein [Aureimonas sp. AU4]BAT30301.1 hypothetical protein [Aureimonas sp. AU4]
MSDYRNSNGYGRYNEDRDDRFGRTDERTARRDAYGDDRYRSESGAYGRDDTGRYGSRDSERGESGYGRGSSGDYLSSATRGYGRSSYGGSDFDRGYNADRGYNDRGYGSNSPGYGYNSGGSTSGDRYRDAFGYGNDRRNDGYGYGSNSGYGNSQSGERSFIDRASDEISSWFGDRDAERRREADHQYGGRGPKNYTRSDSRIQDDVNDRLTDDHYIDASDIEVSVKDREVTLSGHVANRDQKRRAEDLAERISGVSHVQNNLRVKNDGDSLFGTAKTTTGSSSSSGSSIL